MINIGDYVKLKNSSIEGKVINILNDNKYIIDINEKNIITNYNNLTKIKNKKEKTDTTIKIYFSENYKKNKFIPEIMIRHQTVEEAMYNLDIFISEAIYHNIKSVKIIHGKHGGILRKAVHDYLKTNTNIISFRLGNYFEGSYGITIAMLK